MIISRIVKYRGRDIPVTKLKPSSCIKVEVKCPKCKQVRHVHYRSLTRAGHHICQSCKMKEFRKPIKQGTRFGMLEVIAIGRLSGYSLCQCDCGEQKDIYNQNLFAGQKSCNCIKRNNFDDVTRPKGEKHGMWKGGISRERERLMQTKEYSDWRKKIFERDNYSCAKCGIKGTTLNAHHIHSFSEHPNERFDIENGITLCEKCHSKFHTQFGRINIGDKELHVFVKGNSNERSA